MKFKRGDRISVSENGNTGTISGTANSNNGPVYFLDWDHFQGTITYMADQVDDIWTKIKDIQNSLHAETADSDALDAMSYMMGVLPGESSAAHSAPGRELPYSGTWTQKKECDHKWVNASLQFEKLCCYHCGIDKP